MPSLFPENDVPVLRRDLSDDLHVKLQAMRAELARTSVAVVQSPSNIEDFDTPLTGPRLEAQELAFNVVTMRRRVLAAFARGGFGGPSKPAALRLLGEMTDGLLRRDLDLAFSAQARFDTEGAAIAGMTLTRPALAAALTADDLPYLEIRITKVIGTGDKEKKIKTTVRHTLPGFRAEARPTAAEITQLLDAQEMLGPTPDRIFRIGLLRAEILAARNEPDAAIAGYRALLLPVPAGTGSRSAR